MMNSDLHAERVDVDHGPPVWFLSVDGVVNALGPADHHDVDDFVSTVAATRGETRSITFSPSIIDRINRLSCDRIVEIRWVSEWEQDARSLFAPAVGLDAFLAHSNPQEVESPMSWWKGAIVIGEYLKSGRPFIWTDDELDEEIVESFSEEPVPLLLLAPDPAVGLTQTQLDQIEEFARSDLSGANAVKDGAREESSNDQ